MSDNPGLKAEELRDRVEDCVWDRLIGPDAPVVAVTLHGSYTFAVDAAEWDGERIVLRLREIGRA